jgi:response regulator NasT
MEEKGRLLVQSIEQVMQENISMAKAPPLRIVVVEDDPDSQQYFCDVINEQHHDVVGRAGSGPEMVRVVLEKRPDMVIFDIRLPGFDGLTALREIMKQYVLPSVAITGDEGIEMMERATQDDIIGGYNIKPVNKSQLIAAIRVAWAKWKQFLSISDEAEEVKVKLANRKIIERAKDRIAKMYGWSGDTAMRAMQRVSSQNNWTLVETAEKINLGKNVIPVEAK